MISDKKRKGYERSVEQGQTFDGLIDKMPVSIRERSGGPKIKNIKYDLQSLRIARSERELAESAAL